MNNSKFDKFSITDKQIRELFELMGQHQVVVIVGPTGSGKSTFLPYRLLVPPTGLPSDLFTRNGQIVVTEPRIQSVRNIPAYIAKELHDSYLGAGFDIGFKYRNNTAADSHCKLVFMTDGTLVNMIAHNELESLSVIMIDEAHERSLNIDLILGLLKTQLHLYPHLKLIIASATIDIDLFINFFGGTRNVGKFVFNEARRFQVEVRFHTGNPLPLEQYPMEMADEVASKVVDVLLAMKSGKEPVVGDVLAFLHSAKAIELACASIRRKIKANSDLANSTDVYPLYTALPQEEQNKVLLRKPDPLRRRVVVATNVAESSLTVEDISHVVDSGLIYQSEWDPFAQADNVVVRTHAQSGCKQRWGRAGRQGLGVAHCLYTEEQFNQFAPFTSYLPQIVRSSLEFVILKAKEAGVDAIEKFDWIHRLNQAELNRATNMLQQIGAIDYENDLTEHGLRLLKSGLDINNANLMILADRFGCAVEMATFLAMVKVGGLRFLLHTDSKWDSATRRQVDHLHHAMKNGCKDDLEFCLKLYTCWSEAKWEEQPLAPEWAVSQEWSRFMPAINVTMKNRLGNKEESFRKAIRKVLSSRDLEKVVAVFGMADLAEDWLSRAKTAFNNAQSTAWAKAFYVNERFFKEQIEWERISLLESLIGHKRRDKIRSIDFGMLDRVRILLAYCLQDKIYIRSTRSNKADQKPHTAVSQNDHSTVSNSFVPWIGSRKDSLRIQISNDSVLREPFHDAFVSEKQQLVSRTVKQTGSFSRILRVSYLTTIKPEWLKGIASAGNSLISLTKYIKTNAHIIKKGHMQNGLVKRLLVDQVFPIGSQYECEVLLRLEDGMYDVRLLRYMSSPHKITEVFGTDKYDMDNLNDVDQISQPNNLVDTVLTDGFPILASESDVMPAWISLEDDNDGVNEMIDDPPTSNNRRQLQTWAGGPKSRLTNGDYKTGQIVYAEIENYDFEFDEPIILLSPLPDFDNSNNKAQK